ncbi:MAG: flavodoxin-dependent (E)-4-hydroxy-3-methylbut-2-enyl-diphosphate synthase [Buchnera aphidicola (Meitanaphis elongallis)]
MNMNQCIKRRKSDRIYIGNVPIGDNAPVSVQTMTNTETTDIISTVKQIMQFKHVGADIVRVAVPTIEAANAFQKIKKQVDIPLIADVHFNYRIAIRVLNDGADGLRINPGNIGNKNKIKQVINCAKYNNVPIRIGVNAGSLEKDILEKYKFPTPEALLESAMRHVNYLESFNFDQFKVSVKASDIYVAIEAYKLLATKVNQPLHIGITESGGFRNGTVKSSIGIGLLLLDGIGDTIRVSLAENPIEEVKVGFDILRTLRIRLKGINFIACPTCSRQEFDVIKTVQVLEKRLEDVKTPMNISIIGCVVNGLGEALTSTIGITGYRKNSVLYEDGIRQLKRIDNDHIVDELERKIRDKSKKLLFLA